MNTKTLKALAVLALLAASVAHAATAAPTDGGTADYISPGIGTLIMSWLSQLR